MATPQPQADNSLPFRTTPQSAVPLGSTAGSDKAPAGENALKKPASAIEKPVLRTSFSASAAASAPIAATPPAAPKFMSAPNTTSPAAPAAANGPDQEAEKKTEGEKKFERGKKGD